ncbi:DUF3224 domain-containing protein [Lysobacter humi (ex Lee et al. 2017)]
MPTAKGRFSIQKIPQPMLDLGGDAQAMHLRFDKQFEGALKATGVVQFMAVGNPSKGSAAYVAVERIDGTLDGRRGSFMTRHPGVMDAGAMSLDLAVVPQSGNGELEGLRGTMSIDIIDGEHFYTLDYQLS